MKIRMKIIGAIGAIGLAGGIVAMAGGTAFACSGTCSNGSGPVTATASVGETISLTGLTSTISFGSLTAGQTSYASADPAEMYTVTTNDPNGMSLSLTPSAAYLSNGGSGAANEITNGNGSGSGTGIYVQELGQNANAAKQFNGASAMAVDNETSSGTWNYSEEWSLVAPPTLPNGGTYTESFTYLALAS
jgi:hypothetical protein